MSEQKGKLACTAGQEARYAELPGDLLTLSTLLNRAGQLPGVTDRTPRKTLCDLPRRRAPSSANPASQGHRYRLDAIDLNWRDQHNLLPRSEPIIYLSPLI